VVQSDPDRLSGPGGGTEPVGTLWLTAGAAARDEYNRPLDTIASLLPAVIAGPAGRGRIIVLSFLPALSYIKPALAARRLLERQAEEERRAAENVAAARAAGAGSDQPLATSAAVSAPQEASSLAPADREFLERSCNRWRFPAGIGDRLLTPVRDARLTPSLTCDTPLVDAVELRCEQGILIALSNRTLQPLARVVLELKSADEIERVESVRVGPVDFEPLASGAIRFAVPLEASDFITVSTK